MNNALIEEETYAFANTSVETLNRFTNIAVSGDMLAVIKEARAINESELEYATERVMQRS